MGLGTDIAGGYSADIMNAMRQSVAVSRMRQGREIISRFDGKVDRDEGNLAIDWKESLYLATRGGSIALGLQSGTFEVGAPFDAQMSTSLCFHGRGIRLMSLHLTVKVCDPQSGEGVGPLDFVVEGILPPMNEALVEKWWCIGDDRNRTSVWVQGKQVPL